MFFAKAKVKMVCRSKGYELRGEDDEYVIGAFNNSIDAFLHLQTLAKQGDVPEIVHDVLGAAEFVQVNRGCRLVRSSAKSKTIIELDCNTATDEEKLDAAHKLKLSIDILFGWGTSGRISVQTQGKSCVIIIDVGVISQPPILEEINSYLPQSRLYLNDKNDLILASVGKKEIIQTKCTSVPKYDEQDTSLVWEDGSRLPLKGAWALQPSWRFEDSGRSDVLRLSSTYSGLVHEIRMGPHGWSEMTFIAPEEVAIRNAKYRERLLPSSLSLPGNIPTSTSLYEGKYILIANKREIWVNIHDIWIETTAEWILVFGPKEVKEEYLLYCSISN